MCSGGGAFGNSPGCPQYCGLGMRFLNPPSQLRLPPWCGLCSFVHFVAVLGRAPLSCWCAQVCWCSSASIRGVVWWRSCSAIAAPPLYCKSGCCSVVQIRHRFCSAVLSRFCSASWRHFCVAVCWHLLERAGANCRWRQRVISGADFVPSRRCLAFSYKRRHLAWLLAGRSALSWCAFRAAV